MADGNATIGALKVQLGLDSAQFTEGLKKSQSGLAGFSKSAAAMGAVVGVALVGAAVALGASIKGALDRADEMGKAAQKAGESVENFSRLAYAAKLADVDLNGLTGALQKLSVNLVKTAEGSGGRAAAAFDTLGISVTGTDGALKGNAAIVSEVAGKFAGMENGAQKTAMAIAIFGKAGADMIPLLNSGADGIAKATAEADALGLTLSTEAAAGAELFNDNLTTLGQVSNGLSNQMAAALAPALGSISSSLVDAAKNTVAMDAVGKVLAGTVRVLATAAVAAGGVFAYFGSIVGGVASALGQVVKGNYGAAIEALDAGAARANSVAAATGAAIKGIWSDSNLPAKGAGDRLAAPIVAAGGKIKAGAAKAKGDIDKAGKELDESLARLLDGLKTTDEKAAEEFADGLAVLDQALAAGKINADAYAQAVERLGAAVTGAAAEIETSAVFINTPANIGVQADAAAETVEDAAERMSRAFEDVSWAVEDAISGIRNGDWVGALGGAMAAIKNLQAAFKGGTTADKFQAAGGAVAGVGAAIGGRTGSILGGIGSGAAMGAQLGSFIPGIGTAVGAGIGAVLGGITSFFGSSKAKKAQKAAEAQRVAQEAAAKAQEEANRLLAVANERRSLEIQLLELQGRGVEAVALARQTELAAMDESNRGLAESIYALMDANDAREMAEAAEAAAAAMAADVAAERRDLLIRQLETEGKAVEALTLIREDEVAAVDESNRELVRAIHAAEDLEAAQRAQAEAAEAAAEVAAQAAEEALEAAERAAEAQAEIDRAALALSQRRHSLEIELLDAQGRSTEALALKRADEVAALDESLRALQLQIFAAEDLAAAQREQAKAAEEAASAAEKAAAAAADAAEREVKKAADLAAQRRELEIKLLEAGGQAAEATALRRADEIAALDETLRALGLAIHATEDQAAASKAASEAATLAAERQADAEKDLADARSDAEAAAAKAIETARDRLSDAYEREAGALRSTIDSFKSLADSLGAFRRTLSDLGATGGAGQASGEFRRVAALARLGNTEALGSLQGASERFLEASRGSARTLNEHLRNVGEVREAVAAAEATATRQVTVAEQQLASLTASVAGLLKLDASVLSVQQAIQEMDAALLFQSQLQTAHLAQIVAISEANRSADPAAAIAALAAEVAAQGANTKAQLDLWRQVTLDGNALQTVAA